MLNAAKAYLTTQVSTASQGDLLVMLYDTAIKHLRQSIEKMRAGDMAGKGILITKAITIVSELQECLNKERGGEIAQNLFHLYLFCNTRLLMANLKVKPEIVEEVITILSGLRGAFAQILPSQKGVATLTQPGSTAPAESAPADAPPQPMQKEERAAPQVASTREIAAALYVPAQIQAAQGTAVAEVPAVAEIAAAPKAPAPPAPLAAPAPTEIPSASAPGMRQRAANAYATTR